jgi:hypothetical protein
VDKALNNKNLINICDFMEREFKPRLMVELLKEIRDVKRRLMRIESFIRMEELTKEDLKAIKKSEEEIRKGKYVTAAQLKKELGIE